MIERRQVDRLSSRNRAGQAAPAPDYLGPPRDYYRQPALKPPEWGWQAILYFFLGGLAAGCYVVATLADLFGSPEDKPVSRAGRYLALASVAMSPLLLILDLGRPERFHHMLRIFKSRSPMSMGTWGLSGFAFFVGLGALGQAVEDGFIRRSSPLGRMSALVPVPVAGVLGTLFSFFVGSYTGVLLSFTNVPLWAKNRLLQGPLFLASSLSTGIAGISLALAATGEASSETRGWLRRAEWIAIAGEAGLIGGTLISLGSLARPLLRPPYGVLFWLGSVGLGIVSPLFLWFNRRKGPETVGRSSALDILIHISILIGGLSLRVATILAGRQSIKDPSAYLGSKKQSAVSHKGARR